MKVTVKEPGGVLEIIDLYDDGTAEATNGEYYKVSDLHFYFNAIDWEQRRYEIAKDVMAAFISAPSYQFCVNNNYYETSHSLPRIAAEDAVEYAEALIEELKKGKRKPKNEDQN